jgi:TonB-linked outer membrane protein, SusC/RagA family
MIKFILPFFAMLIIACDGFSQITIKARNVTARSYFNQVQKQSGYAFFYKAEHLKKAVKVKEININGDIIQVLDAFFNEQPYLSYKIFNKIITVAPKEMIIQQPKPGNYSDTVKGKIMDENGNALPGASITVKGTKKGATADDGGHFTLQNVDEREVLEISYIDHESETIRPKRQVLNELKLRRKVSDLSMEPVVVNDGLQHIAKERSSGSYSNVSNETFNRLNHSDVLNRLVGVAPGVRIDPGVNEGEIDLSIRGRSTFFGNTQPLVVLDNFPYDGDISNINPNDIENVTILKDAAAASIWGARSGNGVIVINTKKAKVNKALTIRLRMNISLTRKPDLNYPPNHMASADLLRVEEMLTNYGFFDPELLYMEPKPALTPGILLFAKRRAGIITAEDSVRQFNELASYDVRRDFSKYVYRNALSQQYAVQASGGNPKAAFSVSAGFDRELSVLQYNDNNRYTVSTNNIFNPVTGLQISVGGTYTERELNRNNEGYGSINMYTRRLPSYARLADEQGNFLPINYKYDPDFINSIDAPVALQYIPLKEIKNSFNKTRLQDIRLETTIKYQILNGLRLDLVSMYENQTITNTEIKGMETFYTADLITSYYNPAGIDERKMYPIPRGGIITRLNNNLRSLRARAQVNYKKTIGEDHFITGLLGVETGKVTTTGNQYMEYGYDARTGTTRSDLDYQSLLEGYMNMMPPSNILYLSNPMGTVDINRSVFSNISYDYGHKYIITGSVRKDWSNLLGIQFNRKNVMLWSAGLAWELSREAFFNVPAIPYLRLRSSFGFTGNLNKSVSGLVILGTPIPASIQGLYRNQILNAPNPNLGWEKIALYNMGIDFKIRSLINATIEFYTKKGTDLVGAVLVPPTTGLPGLGLTYMANATGLKTHGVDLQVQANVIRRHFRWSLHTMFSYNRDKVTNYDSSFSAMRVMLSSEKSAGIITPIAGKPLSAIYSFRFAGLDHLTGDPLGYEGKVISSNYANILQSGVEELKYHGPAKPVYFGSFINTLGYKRFSLLTHITYRLGYYFRKSTINYYMLYTNGDMNKDFAARWQQPGDEAHTNIPSMPEPGTTSMRDDFTTFSEVNVLRADNIRLQDIKLTYDFAQFKWGKLHFDNIEVYAQVTNMGIIWRANKAGLDPDYPESFPAPKIFSIGFRSSF